jgi:hypothetical protein
MIRLLIKRFICVVPAARFIYYIATLATLRHCVKKELPVTAQRRNEKNTLFNYQAF